jgi:putative AdoMet-dependent methyltransferase
MKSIWTYDEFIQTGTDYTDFKKVEAYDNKMLKFRNYKQEAESILKILNINSNDTLLEIGTGTGHFAIEAAKKCKKVYAIDVSQTMLDYAKLQAEKENITNIEWFNYGFLSFDFPTMQFDCVVSNAALHHLPDFWKIIAINNIYGSLKKQGKLLLGDIIFSCGVDEIRSRIDSWINYSMEIDIDIHSETIAHIKEEYSTFSWIMEGIFERAGFSYRIVSDNNNFMSYLCIKM